MTIKLRTLLLGLLLALPFAAQAATVTYISAATSPSTTASATYVTASFTPTAGSVQFGGCVISGTVLEPPTITNSLGGTYTEVDSITRSTNDRLYAFVADQTSTASAQTVTIDVTGDNGTGGFCIVFEADITRTGSSALKQAIAVSENTAGPSAPVVTFGANVTTTNPTFGCVVQGAQPNAVTEPTNWTEAGDTGFDTPTVGMECAYRNSGYTGTTITWGSSESAYAAFGIELDASAAAGPASFSSVTVGPIADGYDIDYTVTGANAQVYYVVCAPGDAAPNQTELQAVQCGGGNAAWYGGNEAATADVAGDFQATEANNPPRADVYVGCDAAGGDCTISTNADEDRSPRSGFALVALTSCAATGLCDLDSYFDPDMAIGDVFEYEDDTNQSADCNVAIAADGDLTLTPVLSGDCDDLQSFEYCAEDVSSATTGAFTTPSCWSADDTIYVNNSPPECAFEAEAELFVLEDDVAMSAVDWNSYCSDPDAHTITYTVTSGSLPTGTALSGTGSKDWTGTPTSENLAGAAIEITATDPAGDSDTLDLTVYVIGTWAATDCDGLTFEACEAAVVVDAPWRIYNPAVTASGTECSEETAGTILSQDPAASAEIESFEVIDVITAVDCGDPATERKVVFVITDLTGLTRWVDYIPVSEIVGCDAGYYDEDGCWATLPLSSTTGKTAWVDYIPVGEVSPDATGKWRYENNGWIPVDDLTP